MALRLWQRYPMSKKNTEWGHHDCAMRSWIRRLLALTVCVDTLSQFSGGVAHSVCIHHEGQCQPTGDSDRMRLCSRHSVNLAIRSKPVVA